MMMSSSSSPKLGAAQFSQALDIMFTPDSEEPLVDFAWRVSSFGCPLLVGTQTTFGGNTPAKNYRSINPGSTLRRL